MAIIYPDTFPHEHINPQDRGLMAEEFVYAKLRVKLPNNWVVLYNQWRYYLDHQGKRADYVNYEADFIVLVPGKGVAVLEVKNWHQPEIRHGAWYHQVGGKYVRHSKGSPLNQAFLASKSLRNEIQAQNIPGVAQLESRPLAILCGVAENYENIRACDEDADAARSIRKKTTDAAFELCYVVGNAALDDIQQRIEQLFIFNNMLTEEQIDHIREYLLKNVRFKTDPAACVEMMNRVSGGIGSILPMLEDSLVGVHVSGCAGSGKTWMACNEVTRLRQKYKDKKILFLCYNRILAEYLQNNLLKSQSARTVDGFSPLQVATFHALYEQLCKWSGIPFDYDINIEKLQRVRETIRNKPNLRFDYIFVDEAQDIKDDWWDYVITELKANGSSLLYVFSDSNQMIFGKGQEVISLPVRIKLTHNLRNSFEIAQLSTASLPAGARDVVPLPLMTENCRCLRGEDNIETRAEIVRDLIDEILQQNPGTKKRDIVVLSPYVNNSSFNYLEDVVDVPLAGEKLQDIRNRMKRCAHVDATKVLGETVKAFKGLESPFVILTDVNAPALDKTFTPNDFYVACTRAKYGLYIVPTMKGEEYIRQLEQIAQTLPSPLD